MFECSSLNDEYLRAKIKCLNAKTNYLTANTKLKESQAQMMVNVRPVIDAVTKMLVIYCDQAQEQQEACAKSRAEFNESLKNNGCQTHVDLSTRSFTAEEFFGTTPLVSARVEIIGEQVNINSDLESTSSSHDAQ